MTDILNVLQMIVVLICLYVIVALCLKKQCTERGTLLLIMGAVFSYNLVGALTGTMARNYLHEISDMLYMLAEVYFFLGMWNLIGYLIDRPVSRRAISLATIYFSVLLMLRFTNHWHFLFYKQKSMVERDGQIYLQAEPGGWSYVYMISIMLGIWAMFLVCLFVCIKRRKENGKNEAIKYRLMLLGSMLPCMNIIGYLLGNGIYYRIEPFGLFAESMLMLLVVNRYQFLQVVESARELVIETMDIGLIIVDWDYGYLDSNAYASKVFPELAQMGRGKNIQTVISKDDEIFRNESVGELEKNKRYYEWKKSEVYLEKRQRGYAICLYDITEQKRMMERLIEMKRQAEEENEQKSIFLANASHEIRTPMNVILGISEVYMQKTQEPELKNMLYMMRNAGQCLMETLNGILDFSKIEAGKTALREEEYSLERVLEEFYFLMQERVEQRNVEFQIRIGKGVPKFLIGDSGKVRSVLMNLLSNAIKYTKEGNITLQVEVKEKETPWILFQVSDTGIGIAEQDAERIFEKYTQVGEDSEANRQGTGLGLAITQSLVELMGGTIQVETSLGTGSVFQIYLPLVKTTEECFTCMEFVPEEVEELKIQEEETEGQNCIYPEAKALVVDDMETNLMVAQGMLELYHITTKGVLSGEQALEAISEECYDILFIDQMMPGMDGVETLRKIREAGNKMPAIALTAQNVGEKVHELKEAGFTKVLTKPLKRGKLEKVLEACLKEKMQKGTLQEDKSQQDILKSYYYQVSEVAEELLELYREDLDTFLIKIHGIKGASRNIGAVMTANFAEQLETEGKTGNFTYVEEHLHEFLQSLQETLEWVKSNLEETGEEKPRKEKIETEALEYIAEKMEEFELEEAQETLRALMRYSYSAKEEKLLERLERMIINLEYEQASEAIRKFLSEE